MRTESHSFTSQQGLSIVTTRWLPDEQLHGGTTPRGMVLLAHGLGEYAGRYAHVAQRLTSAGWAVFAPDHRGHGQSGGERILIDDFAPLVADFGTVFEQARAALPELPVVVYGHSLGTLVALLFAFDHQAELAGLVLTGCALKPPSFNPVTVPVVRAINRLIPHARALPGLDVTAISRDPAVVAAYAADPQVYHGKLPLCLGASMANAIDTCLRRLPDLRLPVLALHGSADRLTRPEGTRLLAKMATSATVTMHIWDGLYHEVHNEPEQSAVLDEMTAWLEARLS